MKLPVGSRSLRHYEIISMGKQKLLEALDIALPPQSSDLFVHLYNLSVQIRNGVFIHLSLLLPESSFFIHDLLCTRSVCHHMSSLAVGLAAKFTGVGSPIFDQGRSAVLHRMLAT